AVTTTALLLTVEVGIFFGIMPFVSFIPSWTLIMMPLVIILLLGLILGLSYLLSILYVKIPDIQPIWTILMYALLFVSPIFWSIDQANDILLTIQQINPLGQIIELSHKIVFNEIPDIEEWLKTALMVSAILVIGYIFFKKFEKTIVEEL
ncbi:MAG: ABC transporter permease, partial [Nitrosopumilus sp.]|nr:ABC transporter permease [Nitrosopumilus sp.]